MKLRMFKIQEGIPCFWLERQYYIEGCKTIPTYIHIFKKLQSELQGSLF